MNVRMFRAAAHFVQLFAREAIKNANQGALF